MVVCRASVVKSEEDAGEDAAAVPETGGATGDGALANATDVSSDADVVKETEYVSEREDEPIARSKFDATDEDDEYEYELPTSTSRRSRIRDTKPSGRRRRVPDDIFDEDDFDDEEDLYGVEDEEEDYYGRRRKSSTTRAPRPLSKKKDTNRRRRLMEDDYYVDGYERDDGRKKEKGRYGEFVTYFQDEFVEDDDPNWEWETTRSGRASVLLPPLPDDARANNGAASPLPRTILHFIGGAVFGSYPTQFYSDLLLPLAQQTNSVVVATNVPVTIDRNPLDHYALSDGIAEALQEAYEDILCDEFDFDAMKDVPLVGVGHSLGSRLHAVMNTDDEDMFQRMTQRIPNRRAGNVFMGFNNYGASSAVPGVKTLRKGIKEAEAYEEQNRRQRRGYNDDDDDDDYLGGRRRSSSQRRGGRGNRRNGRRNGYAYDDEFYDDDYYDDDDGTIKEDLEEIFGLALASVKSRLTPRDLQGENLEFQPTPDELWSSLNSGMYGERIENTLIVQFDRDRICQGSRLARALSEGAAAGSGDDDPTEASNGSVKYARLEGVHLTPASSYNSNGLSLSGIVGMAQASISFDAMAKEIARERKEGRKKPTKKVLEDKAHEMEALVKTIARFVEEVR